jgi:hypothetical protein
MPNTLFLRNQLEYIQREIIKQEFPERMIANGTLLPLSREIPDGADTYSYRILTAFGSAKILATGVEKRVGFVRTIANEFDITYDELQAAEYANTNINAEMGIIAYEVIMQELDQLGYLGDSNHNLLGMIGHPNVPSTTALNDGTAGATTWASKTPEQIYRDIRNFVTSVRSSTNMVESPDTLLLPVVQYDLIAQQPFPSGTSSTILDFFLENQRKYPGGVQSVVSVPYIDGRGAGGADIAILFSRRESKVKFHISRDFTTLETQAYGMKFVTPCNMRTGGVQLLKPLSMAYLSGI